MKKVNIVFILLFTSLLYTACSTESIFSTATSKPVVNIPVSISTGEVFTSAVTYLAVHNGKVHVGTRNTTDGAQVFVFDTSTDLALVMDNGVMGFNVNDEHVSSMHSFNGALYVSIYNGSTGAKLYRTTDTSSYPYTWEQITDGDFSINPNTPSFDAMIEYNGKLIVGLSCKFSSAERIAIFESGSGNSNTFTKISSTSEWATSSDIINNFAIYNDGGTDSVFLASEKDPGSPAGGCEVWRWNGTAWQARVNENAAPAYAYGALGSGFAPQGGTNNDNIGVPSMLVVSSYLYMGVKNTTSGCKIWRTNDPATEAAYEEVVNDGFGNVNNISIDSMVYFGGYIYAFTRNANGTEMWRSASGNSGTWSKRNTNGFGDSTNDSGRAVLVYNGVMYIGLEKETGENGATIIQYGAVP